MGMDIWGCGLRPQEDDFLFWCDSPDSQTTELNQSNGFFERSFCFRNLSGEFSESEIP